MFSHCGNFRWMFFTHYYQRLHTVFNDNKLRYRLLTNNIDYILNRNRFGSAHREFLFSQLLDLSSLEVAGKNSLFYSFFTSRYSSITHLVPHKLYRLYFKAHCTYSTRVLFLFILKDTIFILQHFLFFSGKISLFFILSLYFFVTNITHLVHILYRL